MIVILVMETDHMGSTGLTGTASLIKIILVGLCDRFLVAVTGIKLKSRAAQYRRLPPAFDGL